MRNRSAVLRRLGASHDQPQVVRGGQRYRVHSGPGINENLCWTSAEHATRLRDKRQRCGDRCQHIRYIGSGVIFVDEFHFVTLKSMNIRWAFTGVMSGGAAVEALPCCLGGRAMIVEAHTSDTTRPHLCRAAASVANIRFGPGLISIASVFGVCATIGILILIAQVIPVVVPISNGLRHLVVLCCVDDVLPTGSLGIQLIPPECCLDRWAKTKPKLRDPLALVFNTNHHEQVQELSNIVTDSKLTLFE